MTSQARRRARRPPLFARSRRETTPAQSVIGDDEATLLDVVDNVLNKGVVLSGDVTIGLAHVDLIYARLSVLLCAADRVLPSETEGEDVRDAAADAPRKARA